MGKAEKARIEGDLAMVQDPNSWPRWPILPVKRPVKGSFPECGSLFADGKPAIYRIGLYQLGDKPGTTYAEKFAGVERLEFPSFEAMLAAGWEVD